MSLILPDLTSDLSTTTGTGTYTLAGTPTDYAPFGFSGLADGTTVYYLAIDVDPTTLIPTGNGAEVGLGTMGGTGTTLARTTIHKSTNANAAVSWAAGTRLIQVVRPAAGTMIVLQPGGTAGTHEVQTSHNGTDGLVESKSGGLRLRDAGGCELEIGVLGNQIRSQFNIDCYGTFVVGSGNSVLYADTGSGVNLASGVQLAWSSSSNAGAGSDCGMKRVAAAVVALTDASTGVGKLLTAKVVEANTAGSGAPNVLAAIESRTVLTNEGATAQNYHTLPTAAAGLDFEFVVQDSDGIRVVASSGDTIRDVATVSAAAGFIQSTTVGSTLRLLAINSTEWIVTSKQGTWTIDS